MYLNLTFKSFHAHVEAIAPWDLKLYKAVQRDFAARMHHMPELLPKLVMARVRKLDRGYEEAPTSTPVIYLRIACDAEGSGRCSVAR